MQVFKVGTFSLAGQVLAFQPQTQTIGASLIGTEKLERLQVGVQLGVIATGRDVKQVSGKLVFKTQDVNFTVGGTGKPTDKTVNLGLGIEVTNHGLPGKLSIEVGLGLRDAAGVKAPHGSFGGPSANDTFEAARRSETKVLMTWSVAF